MNSGYRSNYPPRASGRGGVAADNRPATVAIFHSENRFAVVNTYTSSRGERVSTIMLCTNGNLPDVLAGTPKLIQFGTVEHRDTVSPEQAVQLAQSWLDGKGLIGGGL